MFLGLGFCLLLLSLDGVDISVEVLEVLAGVPEAEGGPAGEGRGGQQPHEGGVRASQHHKLLINYLIQKGRQAGQIKMYIRYAHSNGDIFGMVIE